MTILAQIFPRRYVRASLASHLAGAWAIEPRALRFAVEEIQARLAATPASELRALITEDQSERLGISTMEQATAVIPIQGVIVRGNASCARLLGADAVGLEEIECALRAAAADPAISDIVLAVSSPGGVASGIAGVADLITQIAQRKPVRAEIHGQCASAAYWLVSGCTEIVAERSALVGSIGVYAVIEDCSKAADLAGVKVHLVRSSALKGTGVPGVAVTEPEIAAVQRVVDDLAGLFVSSVASGRHLSAEQAAAVATGEVWIAEKAIASGLIDGLLETALDEPIAPPSEANHAAHAAVPAPSAATKEANMSQGTTPVAAVDAVAEIRAQLEAAQTDLKRAQAERDIAAASLAEVRKSELTAVVDKHQAVGRVTPGMRTEIDRIAAAAYLGNAAGLDTYLGSLPVQVRPNPAGHTPKTPDGDAEIDAIDRAIAVAAGISAQEAAARGSMRGMRADGRMIGADGVAVEVK